MTDERVRHRSEKSAFKNIFIATVQNLTICKTFSVETPTQHSIDENYDVENLLFFSEVTRNFKIDVIVMFKIRCYTSTAFQSNKVHVFTQRQHSELEKIKAKIDVLSCLETAA